MRTLLAASSGGHLAQLMRLRPMLPWSTDDRLWVTFETDQTRSALAGEDVVFLPFAGPRELVPAVKNLMSIRRIVAADRFDHAVSTGASIAVSALPVAARYGAQAHYIESAARVDGPSLTGRMLARYPWVSTHCQYPDWAAGPWHFAGSVFDGFRAEEHPGRTIRKVVVTVGAQRDYPFRSLIDRLVKVLPADAEVLWQVGSTDCSDLDIETCRSIESADLEAAVRAADLVVAHAGVGSALLALENGKCPVLVARRATRGEHVDDHQLQIAGALDERGLAVTQPVDLLEVEDLEAAASHRILPNDAGRKLDLGGPAKL